MRDSTDKSGIEWDLYDIILVLILTFIFTSLFFLIIDLLIGHVIITEFILSIRLLILNFIQAALLGGLTILVLKRRYGISLKRIGFNLNDISNIFKYGIIGGVLICLIITFLNNAIYLVIDRFWGIDPPTQQVIENLLESQSNLLFFLHSFLIIIVAPITEEIFFRCFIYSYIRVNFGIVKGILFSGLFFGLAHMSIWLFLPTFLGGIILAFIYERTKSIYSCILAHSVWNGIIVILLYIIWKINLI